MIDLRSALWTSPETYELSKNAKRFENWEFNYSALLGLGAAVDYALNIGLENIENEVRRLADNLRTMLSEIDGVLVTDIGRRQCGIVSFCILGIPVKEIFDSLDKRKIRVSISKPESTLIDSRKRNLSNIVRASVHYYNDDEISTFVHELEKIIEEATT